MSIDGFSTDSDTVALQLFSTGEILRGWSSYTYHESFLTPSDSWSFTVEGEKIVQEYRTKLRPGAKVTLLINGQPQSTGIIDKRDPDTSKSAGSKFTITGRDMMSLAVDGCIGPLAVFRPGQTVWDLLVAVFRPYGFKIFSRSNLTNRNIITGNDPKRTSHRTVTTITDRKNLALAGGNTATSVTPGTPETTTLSEEYDPTRPQFLKSLPLHHHKPHFGEGAFEFVARVLKRFNLWLWPNALGDTIIVGAPDFTQAPKFIFRHSLASGFNNTEGGSFPIDRMHQPSAIIAVGHGGGGNYAKTPLKRAMVNELTGLDPDGSIKQDVLDAISAGLVGSSGVSPFQYILPVRDVLRDYGADFADCPARVIYKEDDESHTPAQLEGYVRTEMAKFQHQAAIYTCHVRGHSQDGNVFGIDTMAQVNDERAGCQERMWMMSRTFTKSKGTGTRSVLEMCRPYTIEFGAASAAYNDTSAA